MFGISLKAIFKGEISKHYYEIDSKVWTKDYIKETKRWNWKYMRYDIQQSYWCEETGTVKIVQCFPQKTLLKKARKQTHRKRVKKRKNK